MTFRRPGFACNDLDGRQAARICGGACIADTRPGWMVARQLASRSHRPARKLSSAHKLRRPLPVVGELAVDLVEPSVQLSVVTYAVLG